MYHLLGACLALAALLSLNALGSLLATALWHAVARPAHRWSAATRARLIFALRIFPAVGAGACVGALLIPSYLAHEPRATAEVVSLKLAVLALVSIIGIALALWRGLCAWRATRRLAADWMRHGEPVRLEEISIPAYRIRHAFPVIAVVGVLRSRLFISAQVFESLTGEELSAALAHEKAHLDVRDNLKRGLLRACRDVLTIVPCGRFLDREWAEASEAAADERAARAGSTVALNLASALVKIARLAPAGVKPTMPAGAFLIGNVVGSVAWRVRRLTQLAGVEGAFEGRGAAAINLSMWACLAAFLVAIALAATDARVLATMHVMIENIVWALK
jgi:beta-lactamase regulating signal transducer with metallopeptidase domain